MPKEIILASENLIRSLAKNFYGVEKEDLIQAGFLGLTKAYKSFNPELGAKFSTYAYGYIYGEMYETATGNRPIRVRKNEMRLYKGVIRTKELLEEKYGRTVSYEEACAFSKVDYELFLSILNSLSTFISVENTELNLTRKDNTEDLILLKESLETLTPLEKEVIEKRYLNDMSQNETAKVLGLSQVKVSRIESASKQKIKDFVTS